MRKLLIVAATVAALTATAVTPAVAASGLSGPYKSYSSCQDARKKYASIGYKTGPCDKTAKGYYFKFSK